MAGSRGANEMAAAADLVIGIGTRFTDFATASKTAFQNPDVRFVNINVFEMDSLKHGGIAVTGDARAVLEELLEAVGDHDTGGGVPRRGQGPPRLVGRRGRASLRLHGGRAADPGLADRGGGALLASPPTWSCRSAGSLPGDLLKLWRSRESLSYQVEYGYSVMGYEIPGGIGAKLADPSREVFVMSGDASFLMMSSELATAVQENLKITLVLIDNHGFSSVGNVSEQVGCEGFGCHYLYRGEDGRYSGGVQHHDLGKICEGLGADVINVSTLEDFEKALVDARGSATETTAIVVETDWHERVGGYATCWWDMATSEVSEMPAVARGPPVATSRARRPSAG